MLQIENFSYTYPGSTQPALQAINLSINNGESVCLTGHSGCGKTTLLFAIQGLIKAGDFKGIIQFSHKKSDEYTGMVFQNAESQILCTTVEDEVAFGPENMGFSSDEIAEDVRISLDAVGLTGFEKRNVEELSAGEKHRLTIASVLSMKPDILLLDEPTGQLDARGKEKIVTILKRLKDQGKTLIFTDHNLVPYQDIADRFVIMEKGKICDSHATYKNETPFSSLPPHLVPLASSPIIQINHLNLSRSDGETIFHDANMTIYQGERIHLFGENGAGKSSLLRCLTGLLQPNGGNIRITGIDTPRPDQLLGKVAILFQNPVRQLFEDTVSDEVGFSLKRIGFSSEIIQNRVSEALESCEISHLKDRSPLTLSYGEQHRVALASVIALRPEILLLDEPYSGLDIRQRHRILRILSKLNQQYKSTILIASHDPLPDEKWQNRRWIIKEKRISY